MQVVPVAAHRGPPRLHLAAARVHVVPRAVGDRPALGGRTGGRDPVPVVAVLEPAAALHGARGMQVVPVAAHRGPPRLHLAARRVHVVPRAVDQNPTRSRGTRPGDPIPVVFMLEPSCGLHLAARKIHVIPNAIHEGPVSGRRT